MTPGPADQVLAQVRGAVDAALALQTWQLPVSDVAALVEGLAVEAARLGAARLRVLAEAQERRVAGDVGVSTAGWYAQVTHCRGREAVPTVALATALGGPLAPTGAALATGSLSVAHAEVVHRVMSTLTAALAPSPADRDGDPALSAVGRQETLDDAQALLVEHATRLDPDQLAIAGRHLVARLAGPRAGEAAADAAERAMTDAALTLVQTSDGTWFVRGTLPAVGGAAVAAALDAESAPLPAGPDGTRDLRTAPQRRAAALVRIAEGHLGSLPGGSRTRPRVTVTVDARTLVNPWAAGAAPGELTVPGCGDPYGGHPLPAATTAAAVCDADVVPVLIGEDGAPLDVGRTIYSFPERIRAAIIARDGGCTFPHACGRPASHCDVHHLVPFSVGGRTAERNGTLVCTPAHQLVHRHGWTAYLEGTAVVWTEPERAARGGGGARAPARWVQPPPWKPDLDRFVDDWRARLFAVPLTDTG